MEALAHIKDFATPEGSGSIRMKWDGCVHEDTILKTSNGELTIAEVVDLYNKNPNSVQVYGKHLETNVDFVMDILGVNVTTGIKDWVEITFENGSTIKLTEDHEVHTSNRGWVAASSLTIDDDITEMQ